MKLKYYLRGLGIGIIVTTVILMISFPGKEEKLTDEEIIARAKQLGMVMPEEDSPDGANASGDDGDAGNPANNADGASDRRTMQTTAKRICLRILPEKTGVQEILRKE